MKVRKSEEAAGLEPPEQLNRSWREFTQLILAPKRKGRVVKDKPGDFGYLRTSEHCQALSPDISASTKWIIVSGNSSAER